MPVVLSLVERGWQAAREATRALAPPGPRVAHLVKGRVDASVRRLLAAGDPALRLTGVPKPLFWIIAFLASLALRAMGRLAGVLVDNDRSLVRVQRWGWVGAGRVAQAQMGSAGPLVLAAGRLIDAGRWRDGLAGS